MSKGNDEGMVLTLILSVGFTVNSVALASIPLCGTNCRSAKVSRSHCSALVLRPAINPCAKVESPSNAWRGLVPLCSTKEDVERLLRKPDSSYGSVYIYKTEQERVDVVYSEGKCNLSRSEIWNVPKDVLISLEIRPRNKVLIQDLHLDPKKYQRIQESHPENWFFYRNKGEGVMVETLLFGKDERVDSISYFPTTKDSHLRCASQSKRISRNRKR